MSEYGGSVVAGLLGSGLRAGWSIASEAISKNPGLGPLAGVVGTVALVGLNLGIRELTSSNSSQPSTTPEESQQPDSPSSSNQSSGDTASSSAPTNLTDPALLLSNTDPKVIEALTTIRALPQEQREQLFKETSAAVQAGLDAATEAFLAEGGTLPLDIQTDSDDDAPFEGASPPTHKTPRQVTSASLRLLQEAFTPESHKGRRRLTTTTDSPSPTSRVLFPDPTTQSKSADNPSTDHSTSQGGSFLPLPNPHLGKRSGRPQPGSSSSSTNGRGDTRKTNKPPVTPQPNRLQSRTGEQGAPAKSDDKGSPPPLPGGGINRTAIILGTFVGVSFFAYTMAYGLPSFGKIKGWPGAAAAA